MTHRDNLNAMSNKEFAEWLVWRFMGNANMYDRCQMMCPVAKRDCAGGRYGLKECAQLVADWLSKEAKA